VASSAKTRGTGGGAGGVSAPFAAGGVEGTSLTGGDGSGEIALLVDALPVGAKLVEAVPGGAGGTAGGAAEGVVAAAGDCVVGALGCGVLAAGGVAGGGTAPCATTVRTEPRLAHSARVETADRMADRLVDMARSLALTGRRRSHPRADRSRPPSTIAARFACSTSTPPVGSRT
jgi:hypothetical protein